MFFPVSIQSKLTLRRLRSLGDQLRQVDADLAHPVDVRPAHPILHRPSDRRPHLERVDAADDRRQLLRNRLFQTRPHALARLQAPGDQHRLREEIVRKLDQQRQIEPDRRRAPHRCSSARRRCRRAAGRRTAWRRPRPRRSRRSAASLRSTTSSVRSEAGKNCCGTNRSPTSDAANSASVSTSVTQRPRSTIGRKRRKPRRTRPSWCTWPSCSAP